MVEWTGTYIIATSFEIFSYFLYYICIPITLSEIKSYRLEYYNSRFENHVASTGKLQPQFIEKNLIDWNTTNKILEPCCYNWNAETIVHGTLAHYLQHQNNSFWNMSGVTKTPQQCCLESSLYMHPECWRSVIGSQATLLSETWWIWY